MFEIDWDRFRQKYGAVLAREATERFIQSHPGLTVEEITLLFFKHLLTVVPNTDMGGCEEILQQASEKLFETLPFHRKINYIKYNQNPPLTRPFLLSLCDHGRSMGLEVDMDDDDRIDDDLQDEDDIEDEEVENEQ